MKILVINAGSSSLKYQLIDMDGEMMVAKGNCERIGIDGKFTHKTQDGRTVVREVSMPDHTAAFEQVKNALTEGEGKVVDSLSEVSAIGHRIVQGGSKFDRSVLVTPQVIEDIADYAALAPLHNKAHVQGINAAIAAFGPDAAGGGVRHGVPSDHASHRLSMGLPYEYYENTGSAAMVSMEPPIGMSPPAASSCWAKRRVSLPGSSPAISATAPPWPPSRTAGSSIPPWA